MLVKEGAFMCGYGYSVSDPIFDRIEPGSIVPHGTAEAGGYGLAVTEFGEREGMVVYWRQMAKSRRISEAWMGFSLLHGTV